MPKPKNSYLGGKGPSDLSDDLSAEEEKENTGANSVVLPVVTTKDSSSDSSSSSLYSQILVPATPELEPVCVPVPERFPFHTSSSSDIIVPESQLPGFGPPPKAVLVTLLQQPLVTVAKPTPAALPIAPQVDTDEVRFVHRQKPTEKPELTGLYELQTIHWQEFKKKIDGKLQYTHSIVKTCIRFKDHSGTVKNLDLSGLNLQFVNFNSQTLINVNFCGAIIDCRRNLVSKTKFQKVKMDENTKIIEPNKFSKVQLEQLGQKNCWLIMRQYGDMLKGKWGAGSVLYTTLVAVAAQREITEYVGNSPESASAAASAREKKRPHQTELTSLFFSGSESAHPAKKQKEKETPTIQPGCSAGSYIR